MHRIIRRLAGLRSERAFTLVEVLVAGIVLVVGLVMMAQFFAAASARVLDSDIRTVLHQAATEDLETIRGLPYEEVGTTTGNPQGTLLENEDRVVQNVTVHFHRSVVYWTDPSYSGPYPANYRRVTIEVSALGQQAVNAVEVVSNVAGGATGGTLDITVTDVQGEPVPNAYLTITNTHLIPNINIYSSSIKTDSLGRMIVPGLKPDSTTSYVVTASKTGYNTAHNDPGVVVVDGVPYTVVQLTIDKLATMVVNVDYNGNPVAGLNVRVRGPEGYLNDIVATAEGVTLSNIRYSTDLDPYVVSLRTGQGYPTQDIKVVLAPDSTQVVTITLPPPPTTTTLAPTTTTLVGSTTTSITTTTSSTTTTLADSTLRVKVYRSSNGAAIKNARVTLSNGASKTTNSSGWVFFEGLAAGSYGVTVSANNYYDYTGTVAVSGATVLTVYLVHK